MLLKPIAARAFLLRSLPALAIVMILAISYGWIIMGPLVLAYVSPMLATILMPLAVPIAIVVCAVALAAVLTATASRLLTLKLPVAMTATPLLLVINDLKVVQQVLGRLIFLPAANIWTLVGFLVALAIMKPVANWRRDRTTLAVVLFAALLGLDHYLSLVWPMALPGTSLPWSPDALPWSLRLFHLAGLTRHLPISATALLGLAFIGLAVLQRRTAGDTPPREFAPLSLTLPALVAILVGTVLCISLTILFGRPPTILYGYVPLIGLNIWLYAVPTFFVIGALVTTGRKAVWLIFCALSLGPLASWGLQHAIVDARADEAKRINTQPIAWSDVVTKGRPLMLTWSNAALDAKARERGFDATYGFRSNQTRAWYVRFDAGGPGTEFQGPDDYVEIALGRHHDGKRFAAEGLHRRQPTHIHVYDVRNGQRRLIGSRMVERHEVPVFPPQLDIDGSWASDRASARLPREEDTIARIVNDIPSR